MAAAIEISSLPGDVRTRVVDGGTASDLDPTNEICPANEICPTCTVCFSNHAQRQRCN